MLFQSLLQTTSIISLVDSFSLSNVKILSVKKMPESGLKKTTTCSTTNLCVIITSPKNIPINNTEDVTSVS